MSDNDFAIVGMGGDYSDIQDAINDGANAIFLKSGTHTVDLAVTLFQGCHIFGESIYNTVINFESEAYNFLISFDDILIENLRIVNCMNTLGAFVFSSSTNSIVRNCRVEGGIRAATFIDSTYCTFENNLCFNQNLTAAWVEAGSTDNRINNNRITDCVGYGLRMHGAFNKINGNNISGCQNNDGILITGPDNVITTNTCNQNQNGIYVANEGGDRNIIQNNVAKNNDGFGININSLDNAGNIVMGNVCRDNAVADIRFVPGNFVQYNSADTII